MIEPWVWGLIVPLAVVAAWMFKSEAQSDGPTTSPPERAPPEHEVKTALADLRASLDRLQAVLERQHDQHKEELRDIQRQLDRIEGARRLEDALAAIQRQQREV